MEFIILEYEKIVVILFFVLVEVLNVCLVINKCFLLNFGYEGIVFLSNNIIVVLLYGVDFVILVDKFLLVRCKY